MPGGTFKGSTYLAAGLWQDDSKVEYAPNPKREHTKSFARYESYRQAATVGEALKLGSLADDLLFDFEKGHLKVLEPLRQKPLDLFSVKNIDELTYTDKVLAKWVHLANVSDEDGKQRRLQKQVDDSLKQCADALRRDNLRRLSKIETATALDIKDVDSLADNVGCFETPTMMARRSHANEQAKDMLEVVEKEGRALTDFEVLQVLRLWDFRENVSRQNVMQEGETFVYSDTVGIVGLYTGKVAVKEECRRYPEFGRLLNRWLKDNLPGDLGTDFVYTSININKNYAARVHRDGNNVGPSLIKAFGDFSGGELHYYPEDDRSCGLAALDASESAKVDISSGLLLFDGKRAHFVDDFEGERYSLVFFTCPRYERISEENMEYMRAADFPYPTEVTMENVTNLLRKPNGKEEKEAQHETTATVHDAPFVFWPHASPERSEKETHAEEYWKARGIRSRIEEVKGHGRFTFENEGAHRDAVAWRVHRYFALPSEPARKDLILEQFKNKSDAIEFLNQAGAEVPEAVVEAGCCAIRSRYASSWFALFKAGAKTKALAIFGIENTPRSSFSTEGSTETQQPDTTPSKKRNMVPGSAEKTKKNHIVPCAVDVQVGDVVEVQEKIHSYNSTDGAELLVGQLGSVKQIDGDGDVAIHFFDHQKACQWVAKRDLVNFKILPTPPTPTKSVSTTGRAVQSAHAKVGPLQRKSMRAKEKAKEILRQQMAKHRKVPLDNACAGNTVVVEKDGGSPQMQTPITSSDPKGFLKQGLEKLRQVPIFKATQGETEQAGAAASSSAEDISEGSHLLSRRSVAVDEPPRKRRKLPEGERHILEVLAACAADAQIEYKPDGKTAASHPKSFARYATYAKATTFPEVLALGANADDILYDYKLGVLTIINNGNPSVEWDPRFRKLSNSWRRRVENES